MGKVKKSECWYVTCYLYVCLFANMPFIFYLLVKELNQDLYYIKIGLLAIIFIVNLVGVFMLTYHCNDRIQSEKDEIDIKFQQIAQDFKNVRNELEHLSNRSSITNDNMYRTIEMIAETFSDKNCDEPKLKTLKDIINAFLSYEAERQTSPNSEQGQKNNTE